MDGGGLWARTTRTVRGYGARNHVQYVAPKDLLRPGQRKEAELVRRAGCFRSCMPTLHPPSFQPLQCTASANLFACTGPPSNLCAVDAWSVPDIVRVGFPSHPAGPGRATKLPHSHSNRPTCVGLSPTARWRSVDHSALCEAAPIPPPPTSHTLSMDPVEPALGSRGGLRGD